MFGLSTQQMILYGLAAVIALPVVWGKVQPLLAKAKVAVTPDAPAKRTVGDVRLIELAMIEKTADEASDFSSVCDIARKYLEN